MQTAPMPDLPHTLPYSNMDFALRRTKNNSNFLLSKASHLDPYASGEWEMREVTQQEKTILALITPLIQSF